MMKGAFMPEPREQRIYKESITPERFARVRAIFEAAVEHPADGRRAFVVGACADDIDLVSLVEGMLAADARPHRLLDGARAPSGPSGEGRFDAGTVLADRYRILGLLGSGGMGEVYKAFDVILNQAVALKFLAAAYVSEAGLARFRNEVRIARQVSHPNVCRVYDLGMVDGLHFISMEYIDGEDLASLLRRIGRVPQDTAVEFARKICFGLAAGHDRGVLHRDLKPANIMIDGRGQVRITDFGLAALAAEIPLSDRSGTPAYMSPEQKAGQTMTTRSDIYSLGLVVHEMFTGRRWQDPQSTSSHTATELDPAVARVMLRCLEDDPKCRPPSVMGVAVALPGGNPIAAALAAGETPSPEMIAASREKQGFSQRTAILCFAGVVLSLVVGLSISETTSFMARAPLAIPPDALADRAQRLLKAIGYRDDPQSTSYAFTCCDQRAIEALFRYPRERRAGILASHRPAIRSFDYHQHRVASLPRGPGILSTSARPERGLIVEQLDATGRLLRLQATPWSTAAVALTVDWALLFSAAGLDLDRFVATTPLSVPPVSSDVRMAWTGTVADDRVEEVRVEAASWQNRPVFFEVQQFPASAEGRSALNPVSGLAILSLTLVPLAVGGLMAWRNLRQGGSDRRGAAVIAGTAFTLAAGSWALGSWHVASASEATLLVATVGIPVFVAVCFWLVYVALEPYLRRHWPDALVSWTRLCHGQFANQVVASHILAAIVAVEGFGLIVRPGLTVLTGGFSVVQAGGTQVALLLEQSLLMLALGLAFALVAALLRQLCRRPWQANLVLMVLFAIPAGFETYGTGAAWVAFSCCLFGAATLLWIAMLRRFGLLTNLIVWLVQGVLLAWPLTITGWFAGRSMAVHLLPVAVAAWALWVIVRAHRQPANELAW
jgi:serine/threonine-protein kinase